MNQATQGSGSRDASTRDSWWKGPKTTQLFDCTTVMMTAPNNNNELHPIINNKSRSAHSSRSTARREKSCLTIYQQDPNNNNSRRMHSRHPVLSSFSQFSNRQSKAIYSVLDRLLRATMGPLLSEWRVGVHRPIDMPYQPCFNCKNGC